MMRRRLMLLLVVPCLAMANGQAGLYRLMAGAVSGGDENNWFADGTPHPVAYWRPGITGNAKDTAGGNDAVFYGDATAATGVGFELDGVGDYLKTSDSPTHPYFPMTICAWVLQVTNSGARTVACYGGYDIATIENSAIIVSGLPWSVSQNPDVFYSAVSSNAVNKNAWAFISAVFYSSTNRKIYVNGVLSGSNYEPVNMTLLNKAYIIGRRFSDAYPQYFYGNLDEISIFTNALTAMQIGAYYTNSLNAEFSTR